MSIAGSPEKYEKEKSAWDANEQMRGENARYLVPRWNPLEMSKSDYDNEYRQMWIEGQKHRGYR